MELYQQSLGKGKKAQGNQYEAHFTGNEDGTPTVDGSREDSLNMDNQEQNQQVEDPILDVDDMLVEFGSTDIYGDQI